MSVATGSTSDTSLLGGQAAEGGGPGAAAASNGAGGAPGGGAQGQPAATPALPEWLQGYPDDLKGEKALHTYKTPQEVAKALVETKRLVGGSVRPPAADAKPEEWDAFHAKVRPAKPEDYALDVTPEAGWDDGFTAEFRKMAHEAGLSPRQAQRLAAWVTEQTKAADPGDGPDLATVQTTLKTEFGADYPARVEGARRFLRAHGQADEVADLTRRLDVTGLGNHPVLIRALAAAGLARREHQAPGGDSGGGSGMPLAEAKALLGNPKSAYHDPTHADHVRVKREVDAAYKAAFPGTVEAS